MEFFNMGAYLIPEEYKKGKKPYSVPESVGGIWETCGEITRVWKTLVREIRMGIIHDKYIKLFQRLLNFQMIR